MSTSATVWKYLTCNTFNDQGSSEDLDSMRHVGPPRQPVDKFDIPQSELAALERNDASHAMFVNLVRRNLRPADRLLDVGCATGTLLGLLKQKGLDVDYTGADLSPTLVSRASERYPSTAFEVADITRLPFPDNCFDLAVSKDTVALCGDHQRAISELMRVSRRTVIFNMMLNSGAADDRVVRTPGQGKMLLLGEAGKLSVMAMLAPHECHTDQLSIDVSGQANRGLPFARAGRIDHWFVTVVKATRSV